LPLVAAITPAKPFSAATWMLMDARRSLNEPAMLAASSFTKMRPPIPGSLIERTRSVRLRSSSSGVLPTPPARWIPTMSSSEYPCAAIIAS